MTKTQGKTAAAIQAAVEIARQAGMDDIAQRLITIAKQLSTA